MNAYQNARRHLLIFNITVATFFAFMFAYWLFGKMSSLRFPCLFALMFHLYCPGCGCTRAAEALLRFDILGSLIANPSMLLGIATLVHYEVMFILHVRRRDERLPSHLPAVLFGFFLVAFAVLRNILLVTLQYDPLGDHYMFWS